MGALINLSGRLCHEVVSPEEASGGAIAGTRGDSEASLYAHITDEWNDFSEG